MDSAFLGLAAADDYERNKEEYNNRLATGLIGGAALLGAGLGARAILKNQIAKKGRLSNIPNARGGQSGVRTKADVFKSAAEKYPDPGVGKDVQYRNPGSGGTDLSMLITDPVTGEVYRRGGGQSVNQQRAATQGGVNLAKQDLGGENAPVITDNQYLASIRRGNTKLGEVTAQSKPGMAGQMDYVRNRIADSLEAPAGTISASVQFRNLPPASELKAPATSKGIDSEKAARIARNRQKDMLRINDYMSDVLESSISEAEFTDEKIPSNILKLAERAGTGTASAQDVGTFRNWAQSEFKNDPTILGEINENLSSFTSPAKDVPAPSVRDRLSKGGMSMRGVPEEYGGVGVGITYEGKAGMRDFDLNDPFAVEQLKKAGVTQQEASDYWMNSLRKQGMLDDETPAVSPVTSLRQNQTRAAAQDAMNTAENQQDKRTLRNLRRDEDLDLNRTNIDYVQEFMTDRRIELANKGVTGMRAERIIASDPNVKNAIELYAQTGDPNVFQMTRKDAASMPMTVKPQDSSFVTELSAVGEPEVSTGLFMKKDKRGAFTDPIEEREIGLVNRRGEIEERQGELRGRIKQINEDENMFRAAAETKPRKGLSGMNEDDFVVSQLRQQREGLRQEGIQNAETLFDVNAELDAVRRDLKAEKEFGGRAEPKTFTGEPKRLFFEADETGKPVAGTFEVRSDREMQDTANRGGGGRNEANFSAGYREDDFPTEVTFVPTTEGGSVPSVRKTRRSDDFGNLATDYDGDKTQTGSTVTRYGIEPGNNVKVDETIKPSQVAPGTTSPYQNLDDETLSMISLMGKGADAELATKESVARSRGPRDMSGESLKVSEGLRRARIEGRDPKAFLRSYTGT